MINVQCTYLPVTFVGNNNSDKQLTSLGYVGITTKTTIEKKQTYLFNHFKTEGQQSFSMTTA